MKTKIQIILYLGLLMTLPLIAQEYEWNVDDTWTSPGERVIAIIDAEDIGNYDAVGIIGTVVDNNGNWGQASNCC